jgi:hypothetical protein
MDPPELLAVYEQRLPGMVRIQRNGKHPEFIAIAI